MWLALARFAVGSAGNISEARELVREAYNDALDTMESMVGNEGQQVVFNDYVVPAFREARGPVKDGWTEVDIGEYMDFMGEIVEEGNSIMSEAYEEAQEMLSELEEFADGFGDGYSREERRERREDRDADSGYNF
jgi:vacuolar-type H+-ATPase subunit H